MVPLVVCFLLFLFHIFYGMLADAGRVNTRGFVDPHHTLHSPVRWRQ
jgi:hypothetical protein